jgi:hypothetical protein
MQNWLDFNTIRLIIILIFYSSECRAAGAEGVPISGTELMKVRLLPYMGLITPLFF